MTETYEFYTNLPVSLPDSIGNRYVQISKRQCFTVADSFVRVA